MGAPSVISYAALLRLFLDEPGAPGPSAEMSGLVGHHSRTDWVSFGLEALDEDDHQTNFESLLRVWCRMTERTGLFLVERDVFDALDLQRLEDATDTVLHVDRPSSAGGAQHVVVRVDPLERGRSATVPVPHSRAGTTSELIHTLEADPEEQTLDAESELGRRGGETVGARAGAGGRTRGFARSKANARTSLAIGQPPADSRLVATLNVLGIPYSLTNVGNARVECTLPDGRGHLVFVGSETCEYGATELRPVWAVAHKSPGPLPAALANRLLVESYALKLGAWEVRIDIDGCHLVMMTAKIPAEVDAPTLRDVMDFVLRTADRMEQELSGGDVF